MIRDRRVDLQSQHHWPLVSKSGLKIHLFNQIFRPTYSWICPPCPQPLWSYDHYGTLYIRLLLL